MEFVLEQLGGLRDVEARAMFGGHGLYAGDSFFGMIHRGRLYFRTDEESRAGYVKRGMRPFRPNAKQTIRRYFEVPADVIEDARELRRWAGRAVESGGKAAARPRSSGASRAGKARGAA